MAPSAYKSFYVSATEHGGCGIGGRCLARGRSSVKMDAATLGTDELGNGGSKGRGDAEHYALVHCRQLADRVTPLLQGPFGRVKSALRPNENHGFRTSVTDRAVGEHIDFSGR